MTSAIQLIKDLYTPTNQAILVNGNWTIGYNHDINVHNGMFCSEEEANRWLSEKINNIDKYLTMNIIPTLRKTQRIALISLIYDIGIETFSKSTLLMLLNKKDFIGASNNFLFFNKNGRVVSARVARRRAIEKNLFDLPEQV